MGLMAGFFALGGLLLGLTLIVVWAGSLERWMERQEVATERIEANMRPAQPRLAEAVSNPADIRLEQEPAEMPAAA